MVSSNEDCFDHNKGFETKQNNIYLKKLVKTFPIDLLSNI